MTLFYALKKMANIVIESLGLNKPFFNLSCYLQVFYWGSGGGG